MLKMNTKPISRLEATWNYDGSYCFSQASYNSSGGDTDLVIIKFFDSDGNMLELGN